ncbi:MAG: YkgJ family cysteine cluster protein [Deltaproteobacteria bacterium]|nr:YkgJ family cysteine cluster protein [Deltaproteobacteria bacterium]
MDQRLLELQQAKVIEIVHQSARAGVQKILELALSAFYFADHVIQVVESANTLPRPIACQEGCYFCCCNQVELTTPEALFLGHYVEQHFADEEKKGLMSALRRSLDLQAGKHKVEMARIRPPCPLLQDRKCSAYPARPLVCRAMHTLDAEQCEEAFNNRDLTSPPYYAHRHEIYFSISQGLLAGCRAVGCQSAPLELSRALLDYFNQPRPVERWLQGEKVFKISRPPKN